MSTCSRRRTEAQFDLTRQTAVLEDIYDECRDSVRG
jgi:hypothetical protein